MAEERGLAVDAAGFEAAMAEAREKSRAAGKKSGVRPVPACSWY
jgi:alanyl-tRNA synthetase